MLSIFCFRLCRTADQRWVVGVGGTGVHDPARAEFLLELGSLRVVGILRLFLGVEVIEIAEELIEAVGRREELVLVSQVVLAELPGRVAEVLHEVGDARVFGLKPDIRARQADLRQSCADGRLPGDERRASRRATLLPIPVGEQRAFFGDAVDVGRLIAHDATVVAARVKPPDVITHDDKDVRLLRLRETTQGNATMLRTNRIRIGLSFIGFALLSVVSSKVCLHGGRQFSFVILMLLLFPPTASSPLPRLVFSASRRMTNCSYRIAVCSDPRIGNSTTKVVPFPSPSL